MSAAAWISIEMAQNQFVLSEIHLLDDEAYKMLPCEKCHSSIVLWSRRNHSLLLNETDTKNCEDHICSMCWPLQGILNVIFKQNSKCTARMIWMAIMYSGGSGAYRSYLKWKEICVTYKKNPWNRQQDIWSPEVSPSLFNSNSPSSGSWVTAQLNKYVTTALKVQQRVMEMS